MALGPQGYLIVDTELHIHVSRLGTILWGYRSGKLVPFRCGSFGYSGAWVVLENNRARCLVTLSIRWSDVRGSLGVKSPFLAQKPVHLR
jgi:hypothetical protein